MSLLTSLFFWNKSPTDAPAVIPITRDAFDVVLKKTLVWEGGNDDDPQDPGGRTSRGIIQREYNKWCALHGHAQRDVWDAADIEVASIYHENYWLPLRCADYSPAVACVLFDYGVNSGNHQAVKDAQRCLGLTADGQLGPATHGALVHCEPLLFVHHLDARRLSLLENLPTWHRFGRGWSERVAGEDKFATNLIG